jgi:hypothetical protein
MPAPGRPQSLTPEVDEFDESASVQERYYYSVRDKIASDERDEDRRELVRIPTCAVFHKFASGKGVPHSFVGFIRQWPALPEVVVSLRFAVSITEESLADRFTVRSFCRFASFRSLKLPQMNVTTSTKFVRSKVCN